jgi:uncharacterized membrane protein
MASVIAVPVVWYGMHSWLQEFAYRINIGWEVFLVAAVVAVMIALITVSFQAIKSGDSEPGEIFTNRIIRPQAVSHKLNSLQRIAKSF